MGGDALVRRDGETAFRGKAIEFADSVAERQFTDLDDPIDGAYGTFYEFEDDNDAFLTEWGRVIAGTWANTTNLRGFINLARQDPTNAQIAGWYNVVKTYGERYAKRTAELTPFGIYPVAMYRDPENGGVKFFEGVLHGATGMYGQIAKNLLEIGDFLDDRAYHDLAANNGQFVVGLNFGQDHQRSCPHPAHRGPWRPWEPATS